MLAELKERANRVPRLASLPPASRSAHPPALHPRTHTLARPVHPSICPPWHPCTRAPTCPSTPPPARRAQAMMDAYEDAGPLLDVVLYQEAPRPKEAAHGVDHGGVWRAVVDAGGKGDWT